MWRNNLNYYDISDFANILSFEKFNVPPVAV